MATSPSSIPKSLVAVVLIAALAGPWTATQVVAEAFNQQAALGSPLIGSGDRALYAPWAIFNWTDRWGETHPKVFAVAWLIILSGFVIGVLIVVIGARRGLRLKPFGEGAWASFANVEAASLFANSGTILGKLNGDVLAYDGPEHQLLIGASRSGKGRGHVVPTLLAWPRSALVFDVKGELAFGDDRHGFPGTAGWREKLGPVIYFTPTREESACFNILFEVRRGPNEVRDVQNIAEIIADPAGEGSASDFWERKGKDVIVGVILHVLYAEPLARKNLATVREKLRDMRRTAEEMRTTLHRRNPDTGHPEVHPEVLHAAESFLSGEERMQSGIQATAESFFGVFADPILARKTATSDFRIADLMCHERPVTLYLQPPPSDMTRLMPLMRLVLNQITRTLMESQTHA
ncbi:MAG: type IV secretory system conjugative DNA transfer family protein [Terricaulis sp.]